MLSLPSGLMLKVKALPPASLHVLPASPAAELAPRLGYERTYATTDAYPLLVLAPSPSRPPPK